MYVLYLSHKTHNLSNVNELCAASCLCTSLLPIHREFWGTSRRAIILLVIEVAFYIAAMALLGASAKARGT
jgi:hypothetical protein